MTIQEFKLSLADTQPPGGIPPLLTALWYDARGDWVKAHQIVQNMSGNGASLIHAYLHRKEGDISNAEYWYSRADAEKPDCTLQEEWEQMVLQLLGYA